MTKDKMSFKFSPKQLVRIFFQVSLIVSLVVFVILMLAQLEFINAVVLSLMGLVMVFSMGITNAVILGDTLAFQFRSFIFFQKRKLRYLISIILSPLIYFSVFAIFSPFLTGDTSLLSHSELIPIMLVSSWIMSSLMILIYNYFYYHHSKTQAEIENLQLKSIISDTANQLLKQQIHPHLLFNVLNTIKSLYKKDIKKGEKYLVHLAGFLRASISDPGAKIVSVEEELQLCQDYIEMQRVRFGNALNYEVDISPSMRVSTHVPFFAIQILLENAIKHNELTEQAPLTIRVTETNGCIEVKNCLQPKNFKEESTNQGLFNLSERYRLLSGDELEINNKDGAFSVKIKALTHEHHHHRR